jgi:hypothetical protein
MARWLILAIYLRNWRIALFHKLSAQQAVKQSSTRIDKSTPYASPHIGPGTHYLPIPPGITYLLDQGIHYLPIGPGIHYLPIGPGIHYLPNGSYSTAMVRHRSSPLWWVETKVPHLMMWCSPTDTCRGFDDIAPNWPQGWKEDTMEFGRPICNPWGQCFSIYLYPDKSVNPFCKQNDQISKRLKCCVSKSILSIFTHQLFLKFKCAPTLNKWGVLRKRGVALPFTLKGYLKAKEELRKLKYFTMQEYNLQKSL